MCRLMTFMTIGFCFMTVIPLHTNVHYVFSCCYKRVKLAVAHTLALWLKIFKNIYFETKVQQRQQKQMCLVFLLSYLLIVNIQN